MRVNEHKNAIISIIEALGLRYGHELVFRDICKCMAIAIQNGACLVHDVTWEAREKAFIEINSKYSDEEKKLFPQIYNHLVCWLERNPFQDALGQLYMELFASQTKSSMLGQCFTPYHMALICARVTLEDISHKLEQYTISNPLTINECAAGGGVMLIATCEALNDLKFDWQHNLKFIAGDIDTLCVYMCYIQLSLIGARAHVAHHNALSLETWDSFDTPMELLWPMTQRFEST